MRASSIIGDMTVSSLHKIGQGKVRDLYDLGEYLLIVSSDRISAFDVVLPTPIPGKGRILNQMSAMWFARLSGVCPNHVVTATDAELVQFVPGIPEEFLGRSTVAKKAKPLPIECVARGYLAGSLFKLYREMGSDILGLSLPADLLDGSNLPEPIFTPATKAQAGHDENISFGRAADLVGTEVANLVQAWTLELYRQAAAFSLSRGLILADTKFEFGWTADGIIWIDEALTPDSSRYWEASEHRAGQAQPSFDKQFVRDYLESCGWDKRPPAPELPPEVVAKTLQKYENAMTRLA